jgi:hypothetical protein
MSAEQYRELADHARKDRDQAVFDAIQSLSERRAQGISFRLHSKVFLNEGKDDPDGPSARVALECVG